MTPPETPATKRCVSCRRRRKIGDQIGAKRDVCYACWGIYKKVAHLLRKEALTARDAGDILSSEPSEEPEPP